MLMDKINVTEHLVLCKIYLSDKMQRGRSPSFELFQLDMYEILIFAHTNVVNALPTLSCWEQLPFRFLGILVSILARTNVIFGVMRHKCASPSCITMAARSACWVGSQAFSESRRKLLDLSTRTNDQSGSISRNACVACET